MVYASVNLTYVHLSHIAQRADIYIGPCLSTSVLVLGCTGGDNCCTGSRPCRAGEGDCDVNSDCRGDLVCGLNNCQGPGYDWEDDCCMERPSKYLGF